MRFFSSFSRFYLFNVFPKFDAQYFMAWADNQDAFEFLLKNLSLPNQVKFAALGEKHLETLDKIGKRIWNSFCFTFELDLDDMVLESLNKSVSMQENYFLDSIKKQDVQQVEKYWPYTNGASKGFVERRLINGITCCVREKESNEMLGWCLMNEGSISMLHVKEEHRGKKISKLVVINLMERMYKKDPVLYRKAFAHVLLENEVSANLFRSLGFREVSHVVWVAYQFERKK